MPRCMICHVGSSALSLHADCNIGRTWLVGSPAGVNVLHSLLQQQCDTFTRAAACFQLINNCAPQDVLQHLRQAEACTITSLLRLTKTNLQSSCCTNPE